MRKLVFVIWIFLVGWTGNINGSETAWILFFESIHPTDAFYWCTESVPPDWCDNYYYYHQVYRHITPVVDEEKD